VFANGLVIYLLKDASLPAIRVNAVVRAGTVYDPAGKAGLGMMTAGMLEDGGSASFPAEEMDRALEFMGASVNSYMGAEDAGLSLFALKKDLDQALDIFSDVLINPAFELEKLEILRESELEMILRRNDNPEKTVRREALRVFYGPDHPYGRRPEAAGIAAITAADLRSCHSACYRPENVILAVSGDYGSDELMLSALEKRLGSWRRGAAPLPSIPEQRYGAAGKVFFIDKEIPQAFIMVVMRGIKRLDPVEFPLLLDNDVLGGGDGMSSRLWDTVRARKGLAYNIYSTYAKRSDRPGHLFVYCGTKPETYSQALGEIMSQLARMTREPLSAAELEEAKTSKANSFVFTFRTPFDIVTQRAMLERYGYPADYLETYVDNLNAVTGEAAFAAARGFFDPARAEIFVIGDSKKFDKPLSEFGPVTKLEED
jgi:predicted Zn-dependent peptidase